MAVLAIFLILISGAMTAGLTFVLRRLALRRGLMDSAGSAGHRKELRATPNIGGIGIVFGAIVPMVAGLACAWFVAPDWLGTLLPALAESFPGMREQTALAIGLIVSVLALHMLGLIDDRRALPPTLKLMVMAVVAAGIVLGFDVRLLELLDPYVGGRWLSVVVTILWFIVVINAMNFMDNMDGLSSGVAMVAGLMFLLAALLAQQWFVALTLALVIGAAGGFWLFNRPPATIFMGDGGSLPLGFLMAFLTVRTTYYDPAMPSQWYAVFMPLCVLAVPLYDLVSVVLIRLSQGRSPFVGDQQHFSHRLRARGLGPWQTLAIILGCTAVTGASGVLLTRVEGPVAALIPVQVFLTLTLIALYERASGGQVGRARREPSP